MSSSTSNTNLNHQNEDEQQEPGVPADAFPLAQLKQLTLAPLHEVEADEEDEQALYPWERTDIPQKSFTDLQWDQLIKQLADLTVSPEGRLLAMAMRPMESKGAIQRRMIEIMEGQQLIGKDEHPPLRGLSDIRKAVAYAERGGKLVAEDLYAIARNCDVASRTSRYYRQRSEVAPYLAEAASELDACDDLRQTLNHAVEPGGRLSDHASPDLDRLRRAVQSHHDRIRTRVDQLLKSEEMEHHLQDEFFTVREDRYVLPVRVSSKTTVGGIVHGYSSSGQTAFIEPDDLIQLNNQLRWAQIELQEEEDRILYRLSGMVAKRAEALRQSMDILAYLDVVFAGSQLGHKIGGTIPELTDDELNLKRARHPLLWIKFARTINGEDVNDTVPNDVQLEDEAQVMIVSGPNTGGKTVLLKTLGLCSLMARCGLTLPVDEGSKIPLFRTIYTDIGDEQSIEQDLSTFSGHLKNINTFIKKTDHTSLVLLDELFTGTDPIQGAALAVALLEELTTRGATTVVTTHLESLKTLAFQKGAYANASMGFDLDTLAPTYRVIYGLPGSSYAVRIAQRLGFPQEIIQRAKDVLDGQDHQSVEEILATLEDKRIEMDKEQRRLDHLRNEAEAKKDKYQRKYDGLLAREKDLVHKETRRLKGELDAAKALIKEQIAALQRKGDFATKEFNQQELEKLRDDLSGVEKTIEKAADYTRPPEPGPKGLARIKRKDLSEGMEVYAQPYKRKGVVVEYEEDALEAMVQVGALKMRIPVTDLYFTSESARRDHVRGGGKSNNRSRQRSNSGGGSHAEAHAEAGLLPQTSDNTVDLRGMRVDEALEKVELFLDAVYGANLGGAYIIHGHGTGALKRAVRGWLPTSNYVKEFRRGERGEGGDGVTVAFLKSS